MPSFLARVSGRGEDRRARRALKQASSAGGLPVQLLGQSWPRSLYERLRTAHAKALRKQAIVLPPARGQFVLVLWGLEAGSETFPSVRSMPTVIGTPIAIAARADTGEPLVAFHVGLAQWIGLNRDRLGAFSFAPPVLETYSPAGDRTSQIVTYGLRYEVPIADALAMG